MIKVVVKRKENHIRKIQTEGHALFDINGKDIVCAGVSAILIGGINAINEMELISLCDYEVDEGKVILNIKDCNHSNLQVILETLYVQLKTIEESYSNYISIQEV